MRTLSMLPILLAAIGCNSGSTMPDPSDLSGGVVDMAGTPPESDLSTGPAGPDLAGSDMTHVVAWQVARAQDGSSDLTCIWGSGPNDVYVGGYSTILHSTDNGQTFSQSTVPSQPIYGIWGSGPNSVFAVGNNGLILNTTDGGKSWKTVQSGQAYNLNGIWGTGSSIWAVGNGNTAGAPGQLVIRSLDGGQSWQIVYDRTTTNTALYDIWGTAANNLYAAGTTNPTSGQAFVVRSTDQGVTWNGFVLNEGYSSFGSVWGSSASNVFAVGGTRVGSLPYPRARKSVDNGMNWTDPGTSGIPTGTGMGSLWGTSANDLFVLGGGNVYHSDNNAASWQRVWTAQTSPYGNSSLLALSGFSPTNVYAVGKYGLILHFY